MGREVWNKITFFLLEGRDGQLWSLVMIQSSIGAMPFLLPQIKTRCYSLMPEMAPQSRALIALPEDLGSRHSHGGSQLSVPGDVIYAFCAQTYMKVIIHTHKKRILKDVNLKNESTIPYIEPTSDYNFQG